MSKKPPIPKELRRDWDHIYSETELAIAVEIRADDLDDESEIQSEAA